MDIRPPVHVSRREIRRLRRDGRSYVEISDLLGVSRRQIRRVVHGRKCRCGNCPRPRKLDVLLDLTPAPRPRPPAEDNGQSDILEKLLEVLQAAQAKHDAGAEDPPTSTGW